MHKKFICLAFVWIVRNFASSVSLVVNEPSSSVKESCEGKSLVALVYTHGSGNMLSEQCGSSSSPQNRASRVPDIILFEISDRFKLTVISTLARVNVIGQTPNRIVQEVRPLGDGTYSLTETGDPLITIVQVYKSGTPTFTVFIFDTIIDKRSHYSIEKLKFAVLEAFPSKTTPWDGGQIEQVFTKVNSFLIKVDLPLSLKTIPNCDDGNILIVERLDSKSERMRYYCAGTGGVVNTPELHLGVSIAGDSLKLTLAKAGNGINVLVAQKPEAATRSLAGLGDRASTESNIRLNKSKTPEMTLMDNTNQSIQINFSFPVSDTHSPGYITYAEIYKMVQQGPQKFSDLFFIILGSDPVKQAERAAQAVKDALKKSQAMHKDRFGPFFYYPPSLIRASISESMSTLLVVYDDDDAQRNNYCDSADFVAVLIDVNTKNIKVTCNSKRRQKQDGKVLYSITEGSGGLVLTVGDAVSHLRGPRHCDKTPMANSETMKVVDGHLYTIVEGDEDHDDDGFDGVEAKTPFGVTVESLPTDLRRGEQCHMSEISPLTVYRIFKEQRSEKQPGEVLSFVFHRAREVSPSIDSMKLAAWAAFHSDALRDDNFDGIVEKAKVGLRQIEAGLNVFSMRASFERSRSVVSFDDILGGSDDDSADDPDLVAAPDFALKPKSVYDLNSCSGAHFLAVQYHYKTSTSSYLCSTLPSIIRTDKELLAISEGSKGQMSLSHPPVDFDADAFLVCPSYDVNKSAILLSTIVHECPIQAPNSPYLTHLDVYIDDTNSQFKKASTFFFFDLRGAALGEDRVSLVRQAQAAVDRQPWKFADTESVNFLGGYFTDYVKDSDLKSNEIGFDNILEHANVLPCPVGVPFAVEIGGTDISRFHCMVEVKPFEKKRTGTADGQHPPPTSHWSFTVEDKTFTVKRSEKGEIEVTGVPANFFYSCHGTSQSADPCILPSAPSLLPSPYYGYVETDDKTFLFFDFHSLAQTGTDGKERATSEVWGDEVTAMRAVKRAVKVFCSQTDDSSVSEPHEAGTQSRPWVSDEANFNFAAFFWAELAYSRNAKFAVLVLTGTKLEVRLSRNRSPSSEAEKDEVSFGNVNFNWNNGKIEINGQVREIAQTTDPDQFGDGDDFESVAHPMCHSQDSPSDSPYTCSTHSPFIGTFELSEQTFNRKTQSDSLVLVFALGQDRLILFNGFLSFLALKKHKISDKTPLNIFSTVFYFFFKTLKSGLMAGTWFEGDKSEASISQSKFTNLRDFKSEDENSAGGVFTLQGSAWTLKLQDYIHFSAQLTTGWTGYLLDEIQPKTQRGTGDEMIHSDTLRLIPESPLIGAWVINPLPTRQGHGQPSVVSLPLSVLLLFDSYVADSESAKSAIQIALNRFPGHYTNPSAPADLQRPIYEVFAFWYQVELMRTQRSGIQPSPAYFVALVVSGKQILSLKVGAPGSDILLSKEELGHANDVTIRWLSTGVQVGFLVRGAKCGQQSICLVDVHQEVVIDSIESLSVHVVGGYVAEEVAVRVAAVVDTVEYGLPFDVSFEYRQRAEWDHSDTAHHNIPSMVPQLVYVSHGRVHLPALDGPVDKVSHDNETVVYEHGSLKWTRDQQHVSTSPCGIEVQSSCALVNSNPFEVVLYSSAGVGPRDIRLTLKAQADAAAAAKKRQEEKEAVRLKETRARADAEAAALAAARALASRRPHRPNRLRDSVSVHGTVNRWKTHSSTRPVHSSTSAAPVHSRPSTQTYRALPNNYRKDDDDDDQSDEDDDDSNDDDDHGSSLDDNDDDDDNDETDDAASSLRSGSAVVDSKAGVAGINPTVPASDDGLSVGAVLGIIAAVVAVGAVAVFYFFSGVVQSPASVV